MKKAADPVRIGVLERQVANLVIEQEQLVDTHSAEIAALGALGAAAVARLVQLTTRWRRVLRRPAPAHALHLSVQLERAAGDLAEYDHRSRLHRQQFA